MQKLRQIVSDISNDVLAVNQDQRYSFRYLANKFKDKIQVFFRQDARSREVLREANIWKPINCIDLEDTTIVKCCNLGDTTENVKRSVIKIPEAYSTTYGNLLKIFDFGGNEYIQTSASNYQNMTTREYGNGGYYFWLENDRVYINNTTLKKVRGLIVAKDPLTVDILNGDISPCTSPLEAELNYPNYLITVAKQEVFKDLGTAKNIPVDEKPNLNVNQK